MVSQLHNTHMHMLNQMHKFLTLITTLRIRYYYYLTRGQERLRSWLKDIELGDRR